MPSGGSGDDFLGIGFPDEWFWLEIVVEHEAVDGGLKVDDAFEDAALETTPGEDGEEALDSVQPTGRGRSEVECPPGMSTEPFDDLGVFVRGVVIQDDVDGLVGRDLTFDGVAYSGR